MYHSAGPITGAYVIEACERDRQGRESMRGRLFPSILSTTSLILHELATAPSVSGSPIWIEEDGARTLIGLHERRISSYGAAALLNDTMRAQITQWMNNTLPPQGQPRGDCSGWMSDPESFSKVVADHYLRTEYPSLFGQVKKIWVSGDKKITQVYYSTSVAVSVSFVKLPNYVIARRWSHPTGPRCEYDFYCRPSGELVLRKRSCGPS